MKQLLSFFLLGLFSFSWAQKTDKFPFAYSSEKMEKVLIDIENKFKIKYSYLDSIVARKKISLPRRKYSLAEINEDIEFQTSLKITQIDSRFYTISKIQQDSIKNYKLKEIVIEGFVAQGINKTNQKFIIYPQKVETLPGVTDADILLSLQQLPGVKSPNETATGLHVRGGTSDQNLILWDGIRLYHPGHLFGMISGINPNVNQTVNYYNKSTNPKFGERISSVIDIKTTDVISDEVKGNAGINALNADLYFQIPIIKDKLGLQLSGRKSFTEWWQTPTFNQLADKVFQNTNFNDFENNRFEFEDYSAKINYRPSDETSISLTALVIDNNLDFINEIPNYSINNQKMNIINYGYSVNWTQKYSSSFTQKTLLFYSSYDFDYEKRQQFSTTDFEAYKKLNRIVDSGLEFNFSKVFSEDLSMDFGYQLFGNDASHLFSTFNQGIGFDLSSMQLNTINHIGYSFLKYGINRWNFHAGARYNWYGKLRIQSFEPRIFIQKQITDSFFWQLSYERKSQILNQVRENEANDLSLENYVWVISKNRDYPIQIGNQYTAGLIFKKKGWVVDFDLYYKTITGITSFSFGFSNQADTSVRKGNGFTKGIDVLVQKTTPNWRAWMTYTYQDSQNRFDDINQQEYFQINSNIKHAFNVSFNRKWKLFSVAMGWFIHSGKPFSSLNEMNQIATFNSERLPVYHRLDVSAIYQLYKTESSNLKIGFSVYNAYNRKSIISKELERRYEDLVDYTVPRYAVQDYYSLGITPNIFLRVAF